MGVFENFPYTNFHEMNLDWIVTKVKEVITEWIEYKESVDAELTEFRTWFDNLDVQDEVRVVINEMVASGEFLDVTEDTITSTVTAWLTEHITPTTPIVDDTLTISGAAADAKVAGDRILDLKEDIDGIIDLGANRFDPNDYEVGLLKADGTVDSSYTSQITSNYIKVDGAYISAFGRLTGYTDGSARRIAFYDASKTTLNVITTSPPITIAVVSGAVYVRVSFNNDWADYFVGFTETNTKPPYAPYRSEKIKESLLPNTEWLYKFAECSFDGSNVHLSIDDVGAALYSLISNPPTTLWDNEFFGQLKTLHDTYGICITMNCFSYLSTISAYDIGNLPNTWASDFVSAKSWLKFAFHGKNNTINYNSDNSLKTDYDYFVTSIYNATGDYDCIDTGTRLTGFTGSISQIYDVINTSHGITMLWTADDDRNSYYLDSDQTEIVDNRSKYIDPATNLLFIRSMPRLDNQTIDNIRPIIESKPQYGKMVELYCHENLSGTIASGTITRINNALTWFIANGYKSHFLTDIFK